MSSDVSWRVLCTPWRSKMRLSAFAASTSPWEGFEWGGQLVVKITRLVPAGIGGEATVGSRAAGVCSGHRCSRSMMLIAWIAFEA